MVQITGDLAVGVDELASVLGVDPGGDPESPEAKRLERAWDTAVSLVDAELQDAFKAIEAAVLDEVRLEVAQEVYKRTDAPAGASQFATLEGGQQVRGPRDPLNRVYPILGKYRVAL